MKQLLYKAKRIITYFVQPIERLRYVGLLVIAFGFAMNLFNFFLASAQDIITFGIVPMFIIILGLLILLVGDCVRLPHILTKQHYSKKDYRNIVYIFINIIMLFAFIYQMIFSVDNTSFEGLNDNRSYIIFEFLYFSVVTFTTLGYGDILPMSILARSVVMVEVLLFVVYISIILLSLNRGKNDPKESDGDSNAKNRSAMD